jgi:hypothetical protein
MVVCACDPHTKTPAFAFFDESNFLSWRLLNGTSRQWLHEVKSIVDAERPELLIIENQYLPPSIDAVRRFRSVTKLVSARAMITAVFILSGICYEIIEPFAWQRSLGGSNLGTEELKRLSIIKASDIAQQNIDDHNIADAINLGHWWVKTHPDYASSRHPFRFGKASSIGRM